MSRTHRAGKVTSPPGAGHSSSAKRSKPLGSESLEAADKELFPTPGPSSAHAARTAAAEKAHLESPRFYEPEDIVDAPEHHALSKALGILTWNIWDHDVRPANERKRDFVTAFPPANPILFSLGAMERKSDREWAPRTRDRELERFLARDGRPKGIDSVLARYGLKLEGAPLVEARTTPVRDPLQAARERNHALRVLHGSVDIEPKDMDAAKSAFLDHQEKRRAAEEIRVARKRLMDELKDEKERGGT